MDRNLFPLSVTVRSSRSKHTHTHMHAHLCLWSVSMPRLNGFNQRGAFVFFLICGFIFRFSFSLSHAHNLSQQEPNNFSLNAPTALTVDLNTDLQCDRTQDHAPITFWERVFCPQKEGESPQSELFLVRTERRMVGDQTNMFSWLTHQRSMSFRPFVAHPGAQGSNVPAM